MENGKAERRNETKVEKLDRELVVTRLFDAAPEILFAAWTRPELFRQWWVPKSAGMNLVACEMDVRTGGSYRLTFGQPGPDQTMAFFGTYLDVVPPERIVWTNDEGPDGAVTTVTFAAEGTRTRLVLRELYPSKEALEASLGAEEALPEQFAQLDELLTA
ncbi:SRPBCC family protein [Aestuariivirga sp.]|uniref:SRPBCC family protein n=1 Tax=Aestuariivirga sp. TaxID=2650926 RepID=UPI0039E4A8F4